METAQRYIGKNEGRLHAYLALQCALMRRFIARGGTDVEFCERLAPVFHRKYAHLLVDDHDG